MEAAAFPLPRDPLRSGGLAPEVVAVAAGHFQYFTRQPGQGTDREHVEWVTFERPFAIGKYEVTRGEFALFVERPRYRTEARRDPKYGCLALRQTPDDRRNSSFRWNRPGFDQTDDNPVTCVSIRDAMAYARWLSQETGQRYRLPGAAEWQYAARAGSPVAMLVLPFRPIVDICRYAHVDGCSERAIASPAGSTLQVGRLRPNRIGLHDMIGNVEEIVLACLHPTEATSEDLARWRSAGLLAPEGLPENPDTCAYYVATMGGAWYHQGMPGELTSYNTYDSLRVNAAYWREAENLWGRGPYVRNSRNWTGFRIVRDLPQAEGSGSDKRALR